MPDARCFGLVEPIEGKGREGREGGRGRERGGIVGGGGELKTGCCWGRTFFF